MDYGYGGTTSYGAQGGADGGGFLGGSQAGSQDTPGGGKKYGQDTLRPVTIKQLLDATIPYPDADPKIDDASLTQAHFIGQVRQVSPQATNTTYKVDDGTAVIDVKQWVDSDAAVDDEKYVPKEGDYVHVYGKLKEFNGKRHIGPQAIRPVTDFNEINYHLLSATAVHLYFARGPPGQANGGVKSEGDGLFVDGNAGGPNGVGGRKLPAGMSAMTKRIYEFLQNSPQNNEGLHVHDIARQLNVPSNEVFKSGDELILQGFIYTTIDDETWAVLE